MHVHLLDAGDLRSFELPCHPKHGIAQLLSRDEGVVREGYACFTISYGQQ